MRTLLLTTLGFFAMNTQAQFSDKRKLLLFGDPQNAMVQQQAALLNKEAAGLRERDMQVVQATGKKALYQKYKVAAADPFVLVLVGKDGGEKFRTQKPVPAEELFGIVDAMPMRQQEMEGDA